MAERWREVRRCTFLPDAESLRARLAEAGVTARVPDPRVMGGHPTCAKRAPVACLLVPEDQVERALQILAAAEARQRPVLGH